MSLDEILKLAGGYGISSVLVFILVVLGNVAAGNQAVLDGFLKASHPAVDVDKEAHGHWGQKAEDHDQEERRVKNSIHFIHSEHVIAARYLQKMELL